MLNQGILLKKITSDALWRTPRIHMKHFAFDELSEVRYFEPNERNTKQRMPVEQSHKQISSEKFVMNKDETITKMQKDTEELRKRFDESLKKAMNQPSYHLVKGELSEEEEEGKLLFYEFLISHPKYLLQFCRKKTKFI